MKSDTTQPYDILGISSATLCLLHCTIFPMLTILPFGFSDNSIIDIIFAVVGVLIVLRVIRSNATTTVKYILALSIAAITLNVLAELLFNINLHLILVGGVGMITGHSLNYKSHK